MADSPRGLGALSFDQVVARARRGAAERKTAMGPHHAAVAKRLAEIGFRIRFVQDGEGRRPEAYCATADGTTVSIANLDPVRLPGSIGGAMGGPLGGPMVEGNAFQALGDSRSAANREAAIANGLFDFSKPVRARLGVDESIEIDDPRDLLDWLDDIFILVARGPKL